MDNFTVPKVSVLMLTFDRPQFIERSLNSLLQQTYKDWELVVVDDSELDFAKEVLDKLLPGDMRVRYFRRAEPTKIAGASNFGLKEARGEYVAILDDDDYWTPKDKLARQVDFLDSNPDILGCGGGYILIDETGGERARYLKPEQDADIRKNALVANPMVNSSTTYRRQAALEIGGYDESLLQFADWEFWLKMGLKGKLYNFPEYFVYYQMWSKSASFAHQKESARSMLRILNIYKNSYPNKTQAYFGALAYWAHAYLPAPVKAITGPFLSRLKKFIFSARAK